MFSLKESASSHVIAKDVQKSPTKEAFRLLHDLWKNTIIATDQHKDTNPSGAVPDAPPLPTFLCDPVPKTKLVPALVAKSTRPTEIQLGLTNEDWQIITEKAPLLQISTDSGTASPGSPPKDGAQPIKEIQLADFQQMISGKYSS